MSLEDRVYDYAERRFQASGMTTWATVRDVARALRVRQVAVEDAVEGDGGERMFLSYYHVAFKVPRGDYFVETYARGEAASPPPPGGGAEP